MNDYLPHVVGQKTVDRFLTDRNVRQEHYDPGNPRAPMTPVELSAAVFRYGHSQVRDAYEINDDFEDVPVPVFHPTEPDLRGGRPIPEGFQIDWLEFFEVRGAPEFEGNLSRKLDTKISETLFNLPIPGAEAEGSNVLGFRNLVRGKFYGLPSGQDVARRMGIRPISNASLGLGPEFEGEAPLWYYILAESERRGGDRLGPVSGRIVAEVFLNQLAVDKSSYLNAEHRFTPTVNHDGGFNIGEFLKFARVADPEAEEDEE